MPLAAACSSPDPPHRLRARARHLATTETRPPRPTLAAHTDWRVDSRHRRAFFLLSGEIPGCTGCTDARSCSAPAGAFRGRPCTRTRRLAQVHSTSGGRTAAECPSLLRCSAHGFVAHAETQLPCPGCGSCALRPATETSPHWSRPRQGPPDKLST